MMESFPLRAQGRSQGRDIEASSDEDGEEIDMLLEGSSEEGLAEEPSVGCETLRAYCIGSLVALVGTAANVWFQARQPNIYISSFIALVLAHPLGRLWEIAVPQKTIRLPFGHCIQLNPGTWSIKEHTIVTVMATVSLPSATAIDILAAIRLPVFFNDSRLGNDIFFQILVVLSTQLMSIGLAGLARDMIVRPKEMVWPINNAKIALLEAIHAKSRGTARAKDIEPGAWSMSTMRWGVYVCVASFAWHFVVEAVLPVFTYFDWTTWFAPENALLATITGTKNGLVSQRSDEITPWENLLKDLHRASTCCRHLTGHLCPVQDCIRSSRRGQRLCLFCVSPV